MLKAHPQKTRDISSMANDPSSFTSGRSSNSNESLRPTMQKRLSSNSLRRLLNGNGNSNSQDNMVDLPIVRNRSKRCETMGKRADSAPSLGDLLYKLKIKQGANNVNSSGNKNATWGVSRTTTHPNRNKKNLLLQSSKTSQSCTNVQTLTTVRVEIKQADPATNLQGSCRSILFNNSSSSSQRNLSRDNSFSNARKPRRSISSDDSGDDASITSANTSSGNTAATTSSSRWDNGLTSSSTNASTNSIAEAMPRKPKVVKKIEEDMDQMPIPQAARSKCADADRMPRTPSRSSSPEPRHTKEHSDNSNPHKIDIALLGYDVDHEELDAEREDSLIAPAQAPPRRGILKQRSSGSLLQSQGTGNGSRTVATANPRRAGRRSKHRSMDMRLGIVGTGARHHQHRQPSVSRRCSNSSSSVASTRNKRSMDSFSGVVLGKSHSFRLRRSTPKTSEEVQQRERCQKQRRSRSMDLSPVLTRRAPSPAAASLPRSQSSEQLHDNVNLRDPAACCGASTGGDVSTVMDALNRNDDEEMTLFDDHSGSSKNNNVTGSVGSSFCRRHESFGTLSVLSGSGYSSARSSRQPPQQQTKSPNRKAPSNIADLVESINSNEDGDYIIFIGNNKQSDHNASCWEDCKSDSCSVFSLGGSSRHNHSFPIADEDNL